MRVISTKNYIYEHNGEKFPLTIIYKTQKRNITYRYKDNGFIVTTPRLVTLKTIYHGLDKYADKLLKARKIVPPKNDEYIYVLGVKVNLKDEIIRFNNYPPIKWNEKEELDLELKILLLDIVNKYTKYYLELMGIKKVYKVKVRNMSTRYGSNSRATYTISYSSKLIHYDIETIKSVEII